MEDKIVLKFINKVKDKLSKNKTTYPTFDEYAFSTEEIRTITEQNKEKIQELKQDIFSKKKKTESTKSLLGEDTISPVEGKTIIETGLNKEMLETHQEESSKEEIAESDDKESISEPEPKEIKKLEENKELESKEKVEEPQEEKENIINEPPKNSFVNLNEEYQKIVMTKWNEIDYKQIDKDIIDGKDLLNHNYTITYADDAARFIHNIRKRYEVVICYLIGFNNEKKGIYEKTIFSDKMENEWKHLNNYIKVLEKIRSFRK